MMRQLVIKVPDYFTGFVVVGVWHLCCGFKGPQWQTRQGGLNWLGNVWFGGLRLMNIYYLCLIIPLGLSFLYSLWTGRNTFWMNLRTSLISIWRNYFTFPSPFPMRHCAPSAWGCLQQRLVPSWSPRPSSFLAWICDVTMITRSQNIPIPQHLPEQ